MFAVMVIQFVVQAYACTYAKGRDSAVEFYNNYSYSLYIAAGIWLFCILLTSACAEKLRSRWCIYTILYLAFIIAQDTTMVFLSLRLMPGSSAMVASAMQACCSCALSLYSCLFKKKFTKLLRPY